MRADAGAACRRCAVGGGVPAARCVDLVLASWLLSLPRWRNVGVAGRRQRGVEQPLPVAALAHGLARRVVEHRPRARRLPAAAHGLVERDQALRRRCRGWSTSRSCWLNSARCESSTRSKSTSPSRYWMVAMSSERRAACTASAQDSTCSRGLGEADRRHRPVRAPRAAPCPGTARRAAGSARPAPAPGFVSRPWSNMFQTRPGRCPSSSVCGDQSSDVADRPTDPEQRDRRIEAAPLTPISADCAASCISAARTSGRRRSSSAGMSTMTSRPPAESFLRLLHLGQRPGRAGQQDAQGVLRLAQAALQLGDRSPACPGTAALRLLHVQLGLVAASEQPLGDLQAALLQRGVLAARCAAAVPWCGSCSTGWRPAPRSAPACRRTARCWRSRRHPPTRCRA